MQNKKSTSGNRVVDFAETTNNSIAARCFSVNEKQVRECFKKQNALYKMPKGKNAACGRWPMYPELEDRLAAWIEELRSQGTIYMFFFNYFVLFRLKTHVLHHYYAVNYMYL